MGVSAQGRQPFLAQSPCCGKSGKRIRRCGATSSPDGAMNLDSLSLLRPRASARSAAVFALWALLAAGCSMNRYYQPADGYADTPVSEGEVQTEAVAATDSGWFSAPATRAPRAPQARAAAAPAAFNGDMPAPADDFSGETPQKAIAGPAVTGSGEKVQTPSEKPRSPLLIYTGQLVLAVFDVSATQEKALAVVEEFGGYASQRNSQAMVFRVPAERFRDALDALKKLGDLLRLDWSAQDVGEEYRDLQIRLKNNVEMRDRLLAMLAAAKAVEDALAVEQQLERVTLEIERINGQLRSLQDRIAYSTISLQFSPIAVTQVPKSDYRLPFPWLNQLGLEFLMQL